MSDTPLYAAFLGNWVLDPSSCDYEQGDPPMSGLYRIEDRGGRLHFSIDWIDAEGASHHVEFSGQPDGTQEQFPGGDLADAMSVEAVSDRELNSAAYYQGRELMVAQRQLDESGTAMRVIQLVRLPDGTRPTNTAIYRKQLPN